MRSVVIASSALALCACATVDVTPSAEVAAVAGSGLTEAKGLRVKAAYSVDAPAVRAARTVRLEPVALEGRTSPNVSERQREVLAQALNQSLCSNLSRHFEVAPAGAPADLTLRVKVTRIGTTSTAASALSTVAGFLSPVPFTPRLPIGLGSLVVEGSATDPGGEARAVMVWGRGADAFTTKARASTIGDAFALSRAFGADFAKLLIRAGDPFKAPGKGESEAKRPTRKPAKTECEAWGPGPGAAGFLGERFGLPPEVTARRAPGER